MSTEDFTPVAVMVGLVALMIRDDQLCALLVKPAEGPLRGSWALPGGLVHGGPGGTTGSIEEAAVREFERETGLPLQAAYLVQLGAYSDLGRDPRGSVVTVAYLAVAPTASQPRAGGDATDAQWLPVGLVIDGSLRVALDHGQIIADAVERTRALIETTALALSFCEQPFTIPAVRRLYEDLWGLPRDTLDPGTFHRRLIAMPGLVELVDSDEQISGPEVTSDRAARDVDRESHDGGRVGGTPSGRGRPPRRYRAGPLVRESGPAARLERMIERPWPSGPSDASARSQPAATSESPHVEEPTTPSVRKPPGVDEQDWARLLREARSIFWECGQTGRLIPYGELAERLDMNLRSPAFFELLDALCVEEAQVGGPMITALVVNKRTGMPGQRFFVLADSLGREFDSLRDFVESERLRVFAWIRAHPERARLARSGTD